MTRTKRAVLSRVITAALVMCLALGGLFMLDGILPKAGAAVINSNVASASNWHSALSGRSSGDTVNITLTGDVTGATSLTTIPSGVTVNLNMNGHTIAYDDVAESGYVYSTSYTSGSYHDGTYWGLIRNNGTLNITGSGTITNRLIRYNAGDGSTRGDAPQRLAAITNAGNLTIGSGVTVNAYLSNADNEDDWKDVFLYCVGIYNTGTVTTSANINSGGLVATYDNYNTCSFNYMFSYGIFGGTVNVNGGNITVDARTGGWGNSGTTWQKEARHSCSYSFGVYSNTATILGATKIVTNSTEWMSTKDTNCWGTSMAMSVGVLYTGSNYPVIGGGVAIDASFTHVTGDKTIGIPGCSHSISDCDSDNEPDNYSRRAHAVAGFPSVSTDTIGMNNSERNFESNYFGTSSTGHQEMMTPTSTSYYGEQPYRAGKRGNSNFVTTVNISQGQSGDNSGETKTSSIVNGAVSSSSQYVIINRYYNQTVAQANLVRASFRRDTNIISTDPVLGPSNNYSTGILNVDSSQNIIRNGTGGVYNANYYQYAGAASESVNAGTYYNRSFAEENNNLTALQNWNVQGTGITVNGPAPSTGTTPRITVIYVNYIVKKATDVNFITANNGVNITNLTNAGQTVTMTYTGRTAVPGVDFQAKVYDKSTQTDVSNVYTVDGSLAGHSGGKTGVEYSYVANGVTVNGLPKDAGEYEITANVSADNTYTSSTSSNSTSYNRNGKTQTFTLKIEKADITCADIANSYTGTYGATTGKLSAGADGIVPLYSFTARGVNNETPAGTWFIDERDVVRNAGEYTSVAVTFTPSGADANNYNPFTKYVSITVNKRSVTLSPTVNTLTYGADSAAVTYNIVFTNLAAADADKEQTWEDGSTYQFLVNGQWIDYYKGLPAGTYPIKITSFAGAQDGNNEWTIQEGEATVNKAALTVKANDDAITYGASVPNYGEGNVIYSGWTVGTDTPGSALTGSLSVTTNYTQGSQVGTYTITPSGQTAANYTIEYINGSLSVGKKNVTVTPDAVTGMTYGAELPPITYTYTGFYGSDGTSVISNDPSYTTPYIPGVSPVGSYMLTAVVSGLSAQNYSFTAGTRNFAVAKATPDITATPTASIINTQSLAEAVFRNGRQVNPNNSATEVPGYYEFENAADVPAYTRNTVPYAAKFVPTDTDNYNEVTGFDVRLSMSPMAITGVPVISGSAMVDSTLTASFAGMNPSVASAYEITWYCGGEDVGAGASYVVKSQDEGNSIYVHVRAKDSLGFNGTADSALTAEVIQHLNPATLDQLNVTIPSDVVYDGETHAATVTAKSECASYIGDITVYYNGSAEAPKNAGTYQVTVSIGTPVKPAGGYTNQYYGPNSGLVAGTIEIGKADYIVNYTASDKVYDGTTVANVSINATGVIGDDVVAYDQTRAKFNFDSAYVGDEKSVVASGITLTGADAGNYNLVIKSMRKASITKAPLYATAVAQNKMYNGSASVTVTFTGINGYKGSDSESTVQVQPGTGTAASPDAGSRVVLNIQAQLTGTSAANYELNVVNAGICFVEIAKAPIAHTFPSNATIEFGKPLSEATFSIEGSGDGTFAYENADSTYPESTGIYENYVVVFTPTDSVNYQSDSQVVRLTVTTCKVNYTVSVTGTAQVGETLTASTQGLTQVQMGYLRYQWVRIASDGTMSKIPNAVQSSYTLTDADQGYTVAVLTTFEAGSPFEFEEGTTTNVSGMTGIMSGATVAIKAVAMTWWQKIVNWFKRIIAAITGLSLTLG